MIYLFVVVYSWSWGVRNFIFIEVVQVLTWRAARSLDVCFRNLSISYPHTRNWLDCCLAVGRQPCSQSHCPRSVCQLGFQNLLCCKVSDKPEKVRSIRHGVFQFAAINMFHNGVVAFFLKDTTGNNMHTHMFACRS